MAEKLNYLLLKYLDHPDLHSFQSYVDILKPYITKYLLHIYMQTHKDPNTLSREFALITVDALSFTLLSHVYKMTIPESPKSSFFFKSATGEMLHCIVFTNNTLHISSYSSIDNRYTTLMDAKSSEVVYRRLRGRRKNVTREGREESDMMVGYDAKSKCLVFMMMQSRQIARILYISF